MLYYHLTKNFFQKELLQSVRNIDPRFMKERGFSLKQGNAIIVGSIGVR